MIYSLENIRTELLENRNPIKMQRVYGNNSIFGKLIKKLKSKIYVRKKLKTTS